MKCPNCGLNYTGDRCIYCDTSAMGAMALEWEKAKADFSWKDYPTTITVPPNPKPKEPKISECCLCNRVSSNQNRWYRPHFDAVFCEECLDNNSTDILVVYARKSKKRKPKEDGTFYWDKKECAFKLYSQKPKEDTMDQTPTCYHCGEAIDIANDDWADEDRFGQTVHAHCHKEMLQYLSQACKVAKLKADNWNKETK